MLCRLDLRLAGGGGGNELIDAPEFDLGLKADTSALLASILRPLAVSFVKSETFGIVLELPDLLGGGGAGLWLESILSVILAA